MVRRVIFIVLPGICLTTVAAVDTDPEKEQTTVTLTPLDNQPP